VDRVRKLSDPDTRQFRIDSADVPKPTEDSDELSGEDTDVQKLKRPEKGPPGKLPPKSMALADDSCGAANDALKKFFSGR
jgi:hypothetical protein